MKPEVQVSFVKNCVKPSKLGKKRSQEFSDDLQGHGFFLLEAPLPALDGGGDRSPT